MSHSTNVSPELVCLVNEENAPVGEFPKSDVHDFITPLHRAFSVFLFDTQDRLLLQRRSFKKVTWPGIWSNSCCGHPYPGETNEAAARRRLRREIGIAGGELHEALPDFRYRSRYKGIEENEICPVFIGGLEEPGCIDRAEVQSLAWIDWKQFLELAKRSPTDTWGEFSAWSRWEADQLEQMGDRRRDILQNLASFKPTHI